MTQWEDSILSFFVMFHGKYVFAQFMELLPLYEFDRCVLRYKGESRVRSFSCLDQFLAMSFGQLTNRESLRSTILCLHAHSCKLYHLGFRSTLARRTLSDANEHRDWRIYQDFALMLIAHAQRLYHSSSEVHKDISGAIYALDSTTIDLCLNLFPWATYRATIWAIKLHTLFDIRTSIPTFIRITEALCADVKIWEDEEFVLEGGAWYIIDRGYIDFKQFYRIAQAWSFFVTRAKKNIAWKRVTSRTISSADKKAWIRCDQIMKFIKYDTRKDYPDGIRRVKYYDAETKQYFIFLTNNMSVSPLIIAQLYKSRWQVELFFKWVKQHLQIQTFWWHSENAVKTQIWIAVATYIMAALLKKNCKLSHTLYEILQILGISLFEKTPIASLFLTYTPQNSEDKCQIPLF